MKVKKSIVFWLPLVIALAWVLAFTNPAAMAGDKEQVLKVGKKDEVIFRTEVKVGDLTLKPGTYQLQHRVAGSDHFVHFTKIGEATSSSYGRTGTTPAGEAPCKVEPLYSKVSQTAVHMEPEDGSFRVTKILIARENVAHLF